MIFSNIIGNEQVKKSLQKTLESEYLPNTFLFYGPSGVGKTLFAKQMATRLMYDDLSSSNKKRIDEENHPDFCVIRPEGKLHAIENLRKMIKEVHNPPFEAQSKVFIIDDADKMLDSSSNAILKTLEEPNLDNYLILVTSHIEKILLTIRSRCMLIGFSPIEDVLIEKYIIDHFDKSEEVAKYITRISQGSLGTAVSLAKDSKTEEGVLFLLDVLSQKKDPSALYDIEEFCGNEYVFSLILMWFRDLHLKKYDPDGRYLFFSQTKQFDQKRIPSMEIVHFALEKAKRGMDRNIKASVCLEIFFNEVFQTNSALF